MTRDFWNDELFECSFGGIRLDVQTTQDSLGQTLAHFESPGRDGADISDMGEEPRITRCRLVFLATADDDDPMGRFRRVLALKREGETRTFIHPLTGNFEAKIGQFDVSADADHRGLVVVDAAFHEVRERTLVFDPSAGTQPSGGVEDVRASSAAVDDGLVEVNDTLGLEGSDALATDIHTDALALVEQWEAAEPDSITARDVTLALNSFANQLEDETDRLELATDIDRYPLLIAFTRLEHSVRKAGEVFITDTPKIVEWRPLAPTSLLIFCQRTYGADEAEERADQIERLNDLKNPARIEAGTVVKVPAARSSPSLRSPR